MLAMNFWILANGELPPILSPSAQGGLPWHRHGLSAEALPGGSGGGSAGTLGSSDLAELAIEMEDLMRLNGIYSNVVEWDL